MRASTTFWSFVSLVGFGIQQVDAYATLSWKDVRGGEAWCPTGKSMNGNDFNTVMSALPNQPNPLIWPTPSNAPEFGSSMFYYCNTVAFQIGTGSDDINETEPFFANLKSLSAAVNRFDFDGKGCSPSGSEGVSLVFDSTDGSAWVNVYIQSPAWRKQEKWDREALRVLADDDHIVNLCP